MTPILPVGQLLVPPTCDTSIPAHTLLLPGQTPRRNPIASGTHFLTHPTQASSASSQYLSSESWAQVNLPLPEMLSGSSSGPVPPVRPLAATMKRTELCPGVTEGAFLVISDCWTWMPENPILLGGRSVDSPPVGARKSGF